MLDVPKDIKEKAEGRQKFIFNGQEVYEWEQNLEEVHVYMKPPKIVFKKYQDELRKSLKPGEKFPELDIKIESTHIRIGLKGTRPFIDEDLEKKISGSDSFWTLEDEELHLTLQKMYKAEVWPCVFKGHAAMDPATQNEIQKKILLERFQEENPGFDFSGADINGMVPDPRTFMGGVKYS